MRRIVAFALVLAMVPLAGCLQSKDHVTLNKDGSGTIVSTYEVAMPKARELMASMMVLFGQGDPAAVEKVKDAELMNFEHPAWFRKLAGEVEGYDVSSATQTIAEGKRSTRVEATFASLTAAAQAKAFPIMSVNLSKVEKNEKLPKGGWKLVIQDALSSLDPQQTGGFSAGQILPMFESQMKKLAATFQFTVPGKIVETNGTKAEDGSTAAMTIDYNKMLEGKSVALTIVFTVADDVKLKPFTYEPNILELMPRIQGKPPVEEEKKKPVTTPSAESKPGDGKDAEGKGETKAEPKKDEAKPEPKKAEAGK